MNRVALVCAIFCFNITELASLIAQTPSPNSSTILLIDDQPVDAGELSLLIADLPGLSGEEKLIRQTAAVTLIRQRLALRSLLQLGGESIESVIKRELTGIDQQYRNRGLSLEQIAAQRGVSVEAYRQHLRWQIAWSEFLKSRLTDSALQTYFDDHCDRYGGREFNVSQIFIAEPNDELDRQLQELKSSETIETAFAELARRHSQAGSAASGGELGWVSVDGDVPSEVMARIRAADPQSIVGPITSPLGQHWIIVHQTRETKLTWAKLTDRAAVQRDFTQALFLDLVRQQSQAKVQYTDKTLILP